MQRREWLQALAIASAVGGSALGATRVAAQSQRLIGADRLLDAYRKIFASTSAESVCCWYFGTLFIRPADGPEIPVLHAETIMAYRANKTAPTGLTLDWTEIGLLRDLVSGALMRGWINPLNGKSITMPATFRDGPGQYRVIPNESGLAVTLRQGGANVEGVEVILAAEGSRVTLRQTERKVRGLPAQATASDIARLPKSTTILTWWADRSELDDPSCVSATASGAYSFETNALPDWAGLANLAGTTMVRGVMRKARASEVLNPATWSTLKSAYPDFFDANGLTPSVT